MRHIAAGVTDLVLINLVSFCKSSLPSPTKYRYCSLSHGDSIRIELISPEARVKEFVLYSYFRSSASHRVRIAMNLKRIDYEYRAVHLLNNGGEQWQADYAKLNPSREVPALVHTTSTGSHTVAQSMAIIDYLDHVRPETPLFPQEPVQRSLVLQACEIVNSGIQPLGNLNVLKTLEEKFGADQTVKNEWVSHWIKHGLGVLEMFLAPRAGQYSFGNSITAADCFLLAQMTTADRFKVSCEPYPTLFAIRANLQSLDAVKRAAPENQPDTPPAI
jgi:maleylacetoacetate isomerase